MRFADLSLGTKQAIGFGFVLLIMSGVNLYALRNMGEIEEGTEVVTRTWLPRVLSLADLNLDIADLRLNQLGFVHAENSERKRDYFLRLQPLIDSIEVKIAAYDALGDTLAEDTTYAAEARLYASSVALWSQYRAFSDRIMTLVGEGDNEGAAELLADQGQRLYRQFRTELERLIDINRSDAFASARYAEDIYNSTLAVLFGLLGVSLFLSGLLAAWMVRLITVPIQGLVQAAHRVSEGDVDVALPVGNRDEIGTLARAFNTMTASLREAKEQTDRQASTLRDQRDRLSEQNAQLEEKSRDLKRQGQEIARKNEDLELALQRLRDAQQQLVMREKMASLGKLVAGIAHEINNPINFVSSNVNPLRQDLKELVEVLETYRRTVDEQGLEETFEEAVGLLEEYDVPFLLQEVQSLLNGIDEGARRTAEIVRGLRNFSRVDEDVVKEVDVNLGIQSTLLILHNQLKNRIEVVTEFGDLPTVSGYPGRLNQVFLNILANAAQAIDGAGRIHIRTERVGDQVRVRIKDSGPGIPDDLRDKIFEPFFTTKDVGEGTGLGLSISYSIVQEHGGRIELEPYEEGEGTEFNVYLPINDGTVRPEQGREMDDRG